MDDDVSFFILWDDKTNFMYMRPELAFFFAYTDQSQCFSVPKGCSLKPISVSPEEFVTMMYNYGFSVGYLNNEYSKLKEELVLYYGRNPNRLYFNQFLLTGNDIWLERMQKGKLFALCRADEQELQFASLTNGDTGESYIMCFTDRDAVPDGLMEGYPDYMLVHFPLTYPFIINMKVPVMATA